MVLQLSSNAARRVDVNPERDIHLPLWAHPAVRYSWAEWRLIRDAIEGERDVKDGYTWYLPKLDGQDDAEYRDYVDRATFYNFTGRTLAALVGTLFRRKHKMEGYPAALNSRLERISKAGVSFETFARTAAEEYLAVGRFGVLVDLPAAPNSQPQPYFVPYVAENILDWDHDVLDPLTGQEVLSRVVLREWVRGVDKSVQGRAWYAQYRVLVLEPLNKPTDGPASGPVVYRQYLYAADNAHATLGQSDVRVTTPLIRGKPLNYIPFHVFEAARPPLLDIARLNISHYRSYAQLEHGRFYTGLPVYYAEVSQGAGSSGEYYIGPRVVWELPPGSKAGIIEYNGRGLGSLESALREKEAQASSLGGRMIGVTTQSTAETDNQTALRDRNEQALLHETATVLDEGFTLLLRWFAQYANEPSDTLRVIFNKSFLSDSIGSREFRAIQSMYKDGILPIEIVHDYLVKAGVISDEIDITELKSMLENAASFPNQPDFQARKEGYPNAQAKVSDDNKNRELDIMEDELDEEVEARKSAEKQAREARKSQQTDPGVARQRQQLREPPPDDQD